MYAIAWSLVVREDIVSRALDIIAIVIGLSLFSLGIWVLANFKGGSDNEIDSINIWLGIAMLLSGID